MCEIKICCGREMSVVNGVCACKKCKREVELTHWLNNDGALLPTPCSEPKQSSPASFYTVCYFLGSSPVTKIVLGDSVFKKEIDALYAMHKKHHQSCQLIKTRLRELGALS